MTQNRSGMAVRSRRRPEQSIVQTLNDYALGDSGRHIRLPRDAAMPVQRDHAIEALIFARANEALGVRIEVGRRRWQTDHFGSAISKQPANLRRVLAVAIEDQILLRAQCANFAV